MQKEFEKVDGFDWLFIRTASGVYYIVRKVKVMELGVEVSKRRATSLKTTDFATAVILYTEKCGQPIVKRQDIRVKEARDIFFRDQTKRTDLTVVRYESSYRTWAADFLDQLLVSEVTPAHINRVITYAAETSSKKTGKLLSEASQDLLKDALSMVFASFTKEPTLYRVDNPVAFVERANFTKEIEALDEEQIVAVHEIEQIALGMGDWIDPATFMLATIARGMPRSGLRIDEFLALDTTSIKSGDTPATKKRYGANGSLEVVKQLRDRNPKLKHPFDPNDRSTWFDTLKGRIGKLGDRKRLVPMSAGMRLLLDTYMERGYAEGWLKRGKPDLLFKDLTTGLPLVSTSVGKRISRVAEQTCGRRIRSHWFRHTYATNAFTNGATLTQVATALGDKPATVEQVYIHFYERGAYADAMAESTELT